MKVLNILPTLVLGLVAFVAGCESASPCDDLTTLINKSYGFKPSKLTDDEISAKSNELDRVWNLVGTKPDQYLPCLRNEIAKRKEDTFFRFNASNLLYKHDRSVETKKLMIETYAGADLADINLRYWLPYMAGFGREGLDVSKAGETWLRFPKPVYYLPEHGGRAVDKSLGALALFGSMDESMATPALAKLAMEENADFRGVALWLLINQSTAESDRAVRELSSKISSQDGARLLQEIDKPELISARFGKPKASREEFISALNDLLNDKPDGWLRLTTENSDGEKDMVAVFTGEDIPLVRRVRRAYAANATPHSQEWYQSFTQVINTLKVKSKAFSQK